MFGSRARWFHFVVNFKFFPTTPLCNKSAQRSSFCTSAKNGNNITARTSSLMKAVYLVAQYARYEIRTMKAEKEANPQLSEVNERLDKLEEIVKEIAVETKKQSHSDIDSNQVTSDDKEPLNSSAPMNTSGGKDNSKSELGEESKGSVETPNSSLKNPTSQNQSGRAS
ncbi:hypothetical protein RYX36_011920 [Vicia faba]